MIVLKTPAEVEKMVQGGKIARRALTAAVQQAKVGVSTLELNQLAEQFILAAGAKPSFKGYEGFPAATCINVNSGIVHGLPNDYRLQIGDVVSIDLGVLFAGLHTDVSESFEVEANNHCKFLATGKKALDLAVSACVVGNRIGDISWAIQRTVERVGYSVSIDLAGHGVGRELHEDPFIECFGQPGQGVLLKAGMTLAVEVIYQQGRPELVLAEDGWTLRTKDGSLSGLFEKSVAVTGRGVLVLT
ncbi:MAG: type I methionyl aminopeptidase [bacterium]